MRILLLVFFYILSINCGLHSQNSNDITNSLTKKQSILQHEVDSLRALSAVDRQKDLPDKKIQVDFEFRPRAEYRNGYQQLPNDTTNASFFVNQRSRLTFNYSHENKLKVRLSVQDLRVWGQQDPRAYTPSTLQAFEAWAELNIVRNLSLRVGRQRLVYDNQRLFAENDWRISASSHDAMTMRYYASHVESELALAFNQSSENLFGTDYKPNGFTNYKFLAVNYTKFELNDLFTLSTINASDAVQDNNNAKQMHYRFTDGGRIEYSQNSAYLTLAGYYQWGSNNTTSKISAWYLQPEIKYTLRDRGLIRMGLEFFSGNKTDNLSTDRSFIPLYGVAHRFNGSMDLITKFPGDVGNAGLVNPYLIIVKQINKSTELRTNVHTFHTSRNFLKSDLTYAKYLGFENDWLLTFRPNSYSKLDAGFSWARCTETFEVIKKAADNAHQHTPIWFYLSLTLKPTIFTMNFK